MSQNDTFELRGWHVGLIFSSFFAVIITVNIALAYSAVSTFPGIEVKNSYVASQSFDARRTQQKSLGWHVKVETLEGGITVAITDVAGAPVQVARIEAILGRATHVHDDQHPVFSFDGRRYSAPATLGPGYWNLRMRAVAVDGTPYEKRIQLFVKG
ncbi:FixH family protein [Roseobacteraceae bacterium S113]